MKNFLNFINYLLKNTYYVLLIIVLLNTIPLVKNLNNGKLQVITKTEYEFAKLPTLE